MGAPGFIVGAAGLDVGAALAADGEDCGEVTVEEEAPGEAVAGVILP